MAESRGSLWDCSGSMRKCGDDDMTCMHFGFVLTCKLGVQLHDACPKLSKAKHLWLCERKTVTRNQCVKREEEEEGKKKKTRQ